MLNWRWDCPDVDRLVKGEEKTEGGGKGKRLIESRARKTTMVQRAQWARNCKMCMCMFTATIGLYLSSYACTYYRYAFTTCGSYRKQIGQLYRRSTLWCWLYSYLFLFAILFFSFYSSLSFKTKGLQRQIHLFLFYFHYFFYQNKNWIT